MNAAKYETGKAKLIGLMNDLFGAPVAEAEFIFRLGVLGEQECWLMADGYLTQAEILSIESGWSAPAIA